MDEYLRLHKAMIDALNEHVQKENAKNSFLKGMEQPNVTSITEQTLGTWDKLQAEEQAALEKLKEAEKAYTEYLHNHKMK